MHPPRRPRLPHLPALDGLRGVAVLAVLLFHADVAWMTGGHLGVSVFFTLSGFLITALLLVEHAGTGTIDLRSFWARRARRLVPAMVLCFGLVAAVTAVSDEVRAGLVGDAVAALAWVANWRFVLAERTYADLFAAPSPFQHFWSLAVEEQFYVVFPIVVLALLHLGRRHGRVVVGGALLGLTALSTVAAAALHSPDLDTARAYYGTDARIAEPLVGALLALVLVRPSGLLPLTRVGRGILQAVALPAAGILGLALVTLGDHDTALYEGGFLAVALSTAVVIAAATQPATWTARALALRPLVELGRISYGVYLFHWPLFLVLDEARTGLAPGPLLAVRLTSTLALALLSYRLVEAPIRFGQVPGRAALLGWANGAVGALAVVTLASGHLAPAAPSSAEATTVAADSPPTTTATTPTTAAAQPRGAKTRTTSIASSSASAPKSAAAPAAQNRPDELPRSEPKGPPPAFYEDPGEAEVPPVPEADDNDLRVAVVGDSVAHNLGGGLARWASEQGDIAVYNLALPACPVSRGGTRRYADGRPFPVDGACRWWDEPDNPRRRALEAFDPHVVVVQAGFNEMTDRKLAQWSSYRRPGDPTFDAWLRGEYETALGRWRDAGAAIVMTNTACADWDRLEAFGSEEDAKLRVTALNVNVYRALGAVTYADLHARVCPAGRYQNDVEGVRNGRPDGMHFSDEAATALARNWLGPITVQAGFQSRPPSQ